MPDALSKPVAPERVLKDLAALWVELGKQDKKHNGAGVLRACAMTLIAAVECGEDAQAVSQTMAELMHEHPSRAIVLRLEPEGAGILDARVFAQCWMPFGGRQQICCEQIEITASSSRIVEIPQIITGLVAPDLPVVLWLRKPGLFGSDLLAGISALVTKVIADNGASPDVSSAREYLERMRARGRVLADLSWTRITAWREAVAQIFDGGRANTDPRALRRAAVEVTGMHPTSAAYFVQWLHCCSPGLEVSTETVSSPTSSAIAGVTLEGAGFSAALRLEENGVLLQSVNGLETRSVFPVASDYLLLREELSILGRDPVFERCVQ